MKTKIKKPLLMFLCCLMLFPVPVQAASKKNVAAAKQVAYDFLEAAYKYDQKQIEKLVQPGKYRKEVSYYMYAKKSPMVKFIKEAHKDHFLYRVNKVKLKKKTGYVYVSVRDLYLREVVEKAAAKADAEIARGEYSQKEYEQRVAWNMPFDYSASFLKQNIEVDEFKIPLVKKSGKWKIKRINSDMASIISCGILP